MTDALIPSVDTPLAERRVKRENPDPKPVDVVLSKIIVAYPWLQCPKCDFVWPRDSSPDPAYNSKCPHCEWPNVAVIWGFDASKMQYAFEWLAAKVLDVLRREHARSQPSEDRQPSPAREIARHGGPWGDLRDESPRHGDALEVQAPEAPSE